MADTPVTVAIVNANPDLVRMLRVNREAAGSVAFEVHVEEIKRGAATIDSFFKQNDPRVIVYEAAGEASDVAEVIRAVREASGVQPTR